MTDPARLLLVGMMGAGKTTVGRALATATGWPYVDNDELVRRARGRSAPEVLVAEGEPALRAAESEALAEALRLPPPIVAGVAAGVVLDAADRKRLRDVDGIVVWLRASVETLASRVGAGAGRAWLQPEPAAALRRLATVREPLLAEVAHVVVDVDSAAPEDVAVEILSALRRR